LVTHTLTRAPIFRLISIDYSLLYWTFIS
jgi:hypothetical protein